MLEYLKKIEKGLKTNTLGAKSQLKLSPEIRYAEQIHQSPETARESSVMLLLFSEDYDAQSDKLLLEHSNLQFVLIKRNDDGHPHSGQISFPGGKYEESDKNFENNAIRETFEEVGVPIENINILDKLTPLYIPVSNYKVNPFVGYSTQKLEFIPDHSEVAYVIKVTIKDLVEAKIQTKKIDRYGKNFTIPFFELSNHHVWGATAMLLSEFRDVLKSL